MTTFFCTLIFINKIYFAYGANNKDNRRGFK